MHCVVNNFAWETIDLLAFVKDIDNRNEVLDGLRHLTFKRVYFVEAVGHVCEAKCEWTSSIV